MNVIGLPADDPLATPLIDLGQRQPAGLQPIYPWMAPTQQTQLPGCTIICVGTQSTAGLSPPAGPPAPAPAG
jgi:hypothetical protein